VPNKEILNELLEFGFSRARSEKALHATGNADSQAAVNWLLDHDDVESIDNPTNDGPTGTSLSNQGTANITLPGFTNIPAKFQLQSVVCHKGTSVHTGHYVAFVRKPISENHNLLWILFNDEKVVEAINADEMKQFAYIYFFRQL
jgi:ubiquitin carboxyl-terminal hydrolase 5/13